MPAVNVSLGKQWSNQLRWIQSLSPANWRASNEGHNQELPSELPAVTNLLEAELADLVVYVMHVHFRSTDRLGMESLQMKSSKSTACVQSPEYCPIDRL